MKKVISLVLTMLMIFSVFTVLPSASAAETYVAGTEVKVTVSLPETDEFTAVEGTVTYGSSLEYVTDSLAFPHIIDPVENTSEVGSIYFNSSSLDPVCDISDDHILLTANFTVLEDVSAIDVVTAIDDIFIVEGTTMNAVSDVTETTVEVVSAPTQPTEPSSSEEPTEPSSSEEPTEPSSSEEPTEATEPTDPTSTGVHVVGDINLELTAESDTIYSGVTSLTAGTYQFKIVNNGVTQCNGATFTNGVPNLFYSPSWRLLSTFKVTLDADYSFTFDTAENNLTIIPVTLDLALIGDIEVEIPHELATYYTAKVDLEPGKYSFKIKCQGKEYGHGKTYTDEIINAFYSTAYSAYTTINITTAGTYNFCYDISTNYITVLPASNGVSLCGDLWDALEDQGDGNTFSATLNLSEKIYRFRIDDAGTKYCNGSECVNAINGLTYKSTWIKATALRIKAAGEYIFTYDRTKHQLTVTQGTLDVAVTGDIALDLEKTEGSVYEGTTNLAIGTYAFKMNISGTDYCNGSTCTNAVNGLTYNSIYSSSTTLKITVAGDYTFSFNALTNTLTVTQDPMAVAITGDIALDLANESGTVYTGTVELAAGQYKFKVQCGETNYCNGGTFTDAISGTYNASYSSATTFNVTGGTYTFSFNTTTRALTVTQN